VIDLDSLPLGAVFLILVFSMIGFVEVGFRAGQLPGSRKNKAQLSQVRAIMGASLGLVAFMLAFAFSMAQSHFETRVQAYFMEISAIDSAFRGADLLGGSGPAAAKDLLLEFANLRVETAEAVDAGDKASVVRMIRESEQLHDRLWTIAELSMQDNQEGGNSSIFAQSIIDLINAHDARLQAAVFNRISTIIWVTLYVMALLGMLVMGFQAGLVGSRSRLATWTLAVTFSVVMALVTDLDRPNMTLFSVNQDLLLELIGRMNHDPASPVSVAPAE
jgi:hypothetical protein